MANLTNLVKPTKSLNAICFVVAWLSECFDFELQNVPDGKSIDDPEYLALLKSVQYFKKGEAALRDYYLMKEGKR